MPLDKLLAFTKKVGDLADKPNQTMSAAEVKAQFDAAPDELRLAFNQLIDDLQSVVDGDSGADNIAVTGIAGLTGDSVQELLEALKTLVDTKSNTADVYSKTALDGGQLDTRYFTETELQSTTDSISGADKIGATPISTSPSTVQGILEWLKQQIDSAVLGQIPDGSVTPVKLSFDPATQAELDVHQAEDAIDAHNATSISVVDANNRFTGTNVETVLDELFQFANNGKTDIASVIGSPATSGDTFTQLKTHIQNRKNELATNLSAKGQASVGTETLDALVDKVALVNTGKKFASGTVTSSASQLSYTWADGSGTNYAYVTVTGLLFQPSYILLKDASHDRSTVYDARFVDTHKITIGTNRSTNLYKTVQIQANAYVNATSFRLPVGALSTQFEWVAYE
jgi:hypothetical protein